MEGIDLVGLGDDPALEFVNTTAALPDGGLLELIGDGHAYVSWMQRLGLIDDAELMAIRDAFSSAELDRVAAEARELRECLRPVIAAWAEAPDSALPADVVERLNTILEGDHRFAQVRADGQDVVVREHRRWIEPRQLLIPPAQAVARVFADGERSLVRNCEGCTMWFYDNTKAHRRRWCSMALCGNRAKARSHRQRAAAAKTE
ncbi:MAG TPA: ABATE domain-containing protein [Trebonia sp.]|nr:ABATE domain-containing protein [Trebonia sp.]